MKTTIELPDDLFIEAKKLAAELRVPLRKLVEEGLRSRLERPTARGAGRKRRIRWITVAGGIPEGLDISNREKMYDWFREPGR